MRRSFTLANRSHDHLRVLFFFLLSCCISLSSTSQTKTQTFDEEWQELGRRLECVMTGAAQSISNNNDISCHREYDFISNTIAWEWENIDDQALTGSWIRAAVFANESDADEWWKDQNLHRYVYDNSIEAAKFNISHAWQIHMDSYPDEIEYNDTIILSGIVEDLAPPYQLFNEQISFYLHTIMTTWVYDCSETPGSFSTSFIAPSKEIAGNMPNVKIDILLYPCYFHGGNASIQVTIPFANFIPDPDEVFSNAKSIGGNGADKGVDLVIDPPYEFMEDPNITTGYEIGDFTEEIEFDGLDLEAPFNSALFLTKLEMDENDNMIAVWGEVIGSTGYTETLATSVTPRTVQDRGVSVMSISGGAIKLGDVTVPRSEGEAFVVVASYDKDGNLLSNTVSDKLSPGQARHNANELVIDDYGSSLILGDFYEDILFHDSGVPGAKTGNNSGDWKGNGDGNIYSQDLFLVKHDLNGNLLWGFYC